METQKKKNKTKRNAACEGEWSKTKKLKRNIHFKMDAQRQRTKANHLTREEVSSVQSANDLTQYRRNMHWPNGMEKQNNQQQQPSDTLNVSKS